MNTTPLYDIVRDRRVVSTGSTASLSVCSQSWESQTHLCPTVRAGLRSTMVGCTEEAGSFAFQLTTLLDVQDPLGVQAISMH